MSVPTLYKSSDSGAPAHVPASASGVLGIIRACLVDGYGSTSPAGWTEAYTGTNEAVFKNNDAAGGTGCHVLVSDASAAAYSPVALKTYASMSSISSGTAPTGTRYLHRKPTNNNNVHDWFLVATDKAFWLCLHRAADGLTAVGTGGGAGDAISYFPGDAYRYFTCGGTNIASPNVSFLQDSTLAHDSPTNGVSFARNHTGVGSETCYNPLIRWGGTGLGVGVTPASPSAGVSDAVAPYILARGGTPLRGRLPGIYVPLFNINATARGTLDTSGLAGVGSEMILMRCGLSAPGAWIETALDWGD